MKEITPPGGPEAYRCKKDGCKANAWSPYAEGWKCHYCGTPAHFPPPEGVKPPAPVEGNKLAQIHSLCVQHNARGRTIEPLRILKIIESAPTGTDTAPGAG